MTDLRCDSGHRISLSCGQLLLGNYPLRPLANLNRGPCLDSLSETSLTTSTVDYGPFCKVLGVRGMIADHCSQVDRLRNNDSEKGYCCGLSGESATVDLESKTVGLGQLAQ